MFGGSTSFQLFRIGGIRVGANWTWLVVLGIVIVDLSGDYKAILGQEREIAAFSFATAVAFSFFGSILLHEFGHAVIARRNGIGILGIDLWMLGGVAKMDREPKTPGIDFRVSAGGPLVTLLIVVACAVAALALDQRQAGDALRFRVEFGDDPWLASIVWLGTVNAFLLVFNLIPAFPLDGGRIARAIAWKVTGDHRRGTVIAGGLGRIFGYLLIGFGVLLMMNDYAFNGIFMIFMGMFLNQTARAAIAQEGTISIATQQAVSEVMDREPVVISASLTVDRALEEYFWRYRWPWFPVVDEAGRFAGLVEQTAVDAVGEQDRNSTQVGTLVSEGTLKRFAVHQDTPLTALLASPDLRTAGALMAVDDDGVLRGAVTIQQISRALTDAMNEAKAENSPG